MLFICETAGDCQLMPLINVRSTNEQFRQDDYLIQKQRHAA